jgi:fumarate hydratase subunit alpha
VRLSVKRVDLQDHIQDHIYELVVRCCTGISQDVKRIIENALEKESNPTARSMMQAMLDNVQLAQEKNKPFCQSPGFPTVYVTFGDGVQLGNIKELFAEALVMATKNGYMRPSMVHPLTRRNPGDNSGERVPNFEFDYAPGREFLDIVLSFKGCGAELGNAMRVFTPAQLGKDYSGLKRFVLETVIKAGGVPCPPVGLGIGIGGQMDVACKLSRRAISIRRWDDSNPDSLYSGLESELLQAVNSLGIGPAGTGGDTTALAVKIEGSATHTAIAPVAINFHCWAARRAGIRIYPDGKREEIL